MKILIIGQGAREHALAWKIAQSAEVEQIWVAPGNAGTALETKVTNISIQVTDINSLMQFAKEQQIDLTLVGPEAPLAAGIVDAFAAKGLLCFGPTQQAVQLEASKSFCKDFLQEYRIPTAKYATFTQQGPAIAYLHQQSLPIVIKADGLAAGKGVVIAQTYAEAEETISHMLDGSAFGEAGHKIVIEEFLSGYELSYIVIADGLHILPLASSQDHKRRDDNDQGPNTGGMGAYSPAVPLSAELEETILTQIIQPTIAAMAKRGTPYTGFLYAGLMITSDNQPKVLEFNCRLGDPEAEPILFRLQSDLVPICLAAIHGQLDQVHAEWDPRPALSVVIAAGGYPSSYQTGDPIHGLEQQDNDARCKIFHAGTQQLAGKVVSHGGRVLAVTAIGEDITDAQTKAYAAVKNIHWPNCYYRTDIGSKAIEWEKVNED